MKKKDVMKDCFKEANRLNEGKGKKKKIGETRTCFLKRGWWTKSREKMDVGREDERKTSKTQNRKERGIKNMPFGGTKENKPLKLQEYDCFGALSPKSEQKQRKTINKHKDTFWHVGEFQLFQLALFDFCKAVLFWKHYFYTILFYSVFSRAQHLCITDSENPFEARSQNGTFATKSAILGLPLCLLKPLFL